MERNNGAERMQGSALRVRYLPYSTYKMSLGAKNIENQDKNERKTKNLSKTLAKTPRHAYNEEAEIAFPDIQTYSS